MITMLGRQHFPQRTCQKKHCKPPWKKHAENQHGCLEACFLCVPCRNFRFCFGFPFPAGKRRPPKKWFAAFQFMLQPTLSPTLQGQQQLLNFHSQREAQWHSAINILDLVGPSQVKVCYLVRTWWGQVVMSQLVMSWCVQVRWTLAVLSNGINVCGLKMTWWRKDSMFSWKVKDRGIRYHQTTRNDSMFSWKLQQHDLDILGQIYIFNTRLVAENDLVDAYRGHALKQCLRLGVSKSNRISVLWLG